jgi:hypothetical protein
MFREPLARKLIPHLEKPNPKPTRRTTPMDRTITTLHEYRTRYPDSAIPTLTQSGLLGLLLDRQRYIAARLARRDAKWRSVRAAPRNLCVSIWRALAVPDLRHSTDCVDVPTRHQA